MIQTFSPFWSHFRSRTLSVPLLLNWRWGATWERSRDKKLCWEDLKVTFYLVMVSMTLLAIRSKKAFGSSRASFCNFFWRQAKHNNFHRRNIEIDVEFTRTFFMVFQSFLNLKATSDILSVFSLKCGLAELDLLKILGDAFSYRLQRIATILVIEKHASNWRIFLFLLYLFIVMSGP